MKQTIKQLMSGLVAILLTVVMPLVSYCQPPDPGDAGNNPDVPFDSSMNIAFLVLGVVFAAFIVYKELVNRRKLAGK
jgi:hypothetical protein